MSTNDLNEAIRDFNRLSGFVIMDTSSVSNRERLAPLAAKIRAQIPALARYQAIRERGFSDDHLATEIGLFVLHINQVICGVMDAKVMDAY